MNGSRLRADTLFLGLLVALVAVFGFFVIRDWRRSGPGPSLLPAPPIREEDPSQGPTSAPVTIIEVGDFQCEFCAAGQAMVRGVLSEHPNQVRHIWKDLPLVELHPQALEAAEAARCAQEQEAFWEMHDALFASIEELSPTTYDTVAKELKLDLARFQDCRSSNRTVPLIETSADDARRAGVSGTPTYFISNGQTIVFNELPTREALESAVRQALE